jgi:hypothetical protein
MVVCPRFEVARLADTPEEPEVQMRYLLEWTAC